jgi:hypothetical protein
MQSVHDWKSGPNHCRSFAKAARQLNPLSAKFSYAHDLAVHGIVPGLLAIVRRSPEAGTTAAQLTFPPALALPR